MNFSAIIRRSTYVLFAVGVLAFVAGCASPVSSRTSGSMSTEAGRVVQAFAKISVDVAKKDGSASVWSRPKLAVRALFPDGQKVALWVASDVAANTSHGYYLDFTSSKTKGTSGMSSWGRLLPDGISLERGMGSAVVGIVGHMWSGSTVRVLVHGKSVDLPVTEDYFLIPGDLTADVSAKFTITLLDQWGKPFGTVRDLSAPGGGTANVSTAATPQPDSALKDCLATAPGTWPIRAVSEGVRAAAHAYYQAKGLLPITIYQNRESVLNLVDQRAGFHWCSNNGTSIGGYQGQVPANATAAVIVDVFHAPYPDNTRVASDFLTIAKIPGKGWQVVGEGTAP